MPCPGQRVGRPFEGIGHEDRHDLGGDERQRRRSARGASGPAGRPATYRARGSRACENVRPRSARDFGAAVVGHHSASDAGGARLDPAAARRSLPGRRASAAKAAGIEHVARANAVAAEADQPGLLQDFQVLRDGRLGERQAAADVAAAAAASLGQRPHDREPHRMAERLQPLGGRRRMSHCLPSQMPPASGTAAQLRDRRAILYRLSSIADESNPAASYQAQVSQVS